MDWKALRMTSFTSHAKHSQMKFVGIKYHKAEIWHRKKYVKLFGGLSE